MPQAKRKCLSGAGSTLLSVNEDAFGHILEYLKPKFIQRLIDTGSRSLHTKMGRSVSKLVIGLDMSSKKLALPSLDRISQHGGLVALRNFLLLRCNDTDSIAESVNSYLLQMPNLQVLSLEARNASGIIVLPPTLHTISFRFFTFLDDIPPYTALVPKFVVPKSLTSVTMTGLNDFDWLFGEHAKPQILNLSIYRLADDPSFLKRFLSLESLQVQCCDLIGRSIHRDTMTLPLYLPPSLTSFSFPNWSMNSVDMTSKFLDKLFCPTDVLVNLTRLCIDSLNHDFRSVDLLSAVKKFAPNLERLSCSGYICLPADDVVSVANLLYSLKQLKFVSLGIFGHADSPTISRLGDVVHVLGGHAKIPWLVEARRVHVTLSDTSPDFVLAPLPLFLVREVLIHNQESAYIPPALPSLFQWLGSLGESLRRLYLTNICLPTTCASTALKTMTCLETLSLVLLFEASASISPSQWCMESLPPFLVNLNMNCTGGQDAETTVATRTLLWIPDTVRNLTLYGLVPSSDLLACFPKGLVMMHIAACISPCDMNSIATAAEFVAPLIGNHSLCRSSMHIFLYQSHQVDPTIAPSCWQSIQDDMRIAAKKLFGAPSYGGVISQYGHRAYYRFSVVFES